MAWEKGFFFIGVMDVFFFFSESSMYGLASLLFFGGFSKKALG